MPIRIFNYTVVSTPAVNLCRTGRKPFEEEYDRCSRKPLLSSDLRLLGGTKWSHRSKQLFGCPARGDPTLLVHELFLQLEDFQMK